MNNQYISNWERGVKPSDENLALLARALEVEIAYFMEDPGLDDTPAETPDPFAPADTDARLERIEAQQAKILKRLDELADHVGLLNDLDREALAQLDRLIARLGLDIGKGDPRSRGAQKTLQAAGPSGA